MHRAVPLSFRAVRTLATALIGLSAFVAAMAAAAATFDLSLEQRGRPRGAADAAVERAGLSTLNENQVIEYDLVENRGKTSAENLKIS